MEQTESKRDQDSPQKSPQDDPYAANPEAWERFWAGTSEGLIIKSSPSVVDVWSMKVYFITANTPKGWRCKIGIAGDPEKRLRTLQLMCPVELHLEGVCDGGKALEKRLHEEFAADRLHGEWFSLGFGLQKRMKDLCVHKEIPHPVEQGE